MGNICTKFEKKDNLGFTALRKKELRRLRAEKKRQNKLNKSKYSNNNGMNQLQMENVVIDGNVDNTNYHNSSFEIVECDICREKYSTSVPLSSTLYRDHSQQGINNNDENYCIWSINSVSGGRENNNTNGFSLKDTLSSTRCRSADSVTALIQIGNKSNNNTSIDSLSDLSSTVRDANWRSSTSVKCIRCINQTRLDKLNRLRPPNIIISMYMEDDHCG